MVGADGSVCGVVVGLFIIIIILFVCLMTNWIDLAEGFGFSSTDTHMLVD